MLLNYSYKFKQNIWEISNVKYSALTDATQAHRQQCLQRPVCQLRSLNGSSRSCQWLASICQSHGLQCTLWNVTQSKYLTFSSTSLSQQQRAIKTATDSKNARHAVCPFLSCNKIFNNVDFKNTCETYLSRTSCILCISTWYPILSYHNGLRYVCMSIELRQKLA